MQLSSSGTSENPIRGQLSVSRHGQELLLDETSSRAIKQVIQHRLIGLGHWASEPVHLEGPYGISHSPAPPFQLARLVHIANADAGWKLLFLEANQATGDYRRGLLCHAFQLDRLYRLLSCQRGDLTIQRSHNSRQSPNPLGWPLTLGKTHLLGVLVPKQPLGQGPVETLYDPLVSVDVHAATSDGNIMLGQQLAHPWTHARDQPEVAWAIREGSSCRSSRGHLRPLLRSC